MDKKLLARYKTGEIRVHGNCRYHNTYNWPDQVFCFVPFAKRENGVVPTLGEACEEWEPKVQECYCIEDALKIARKSKV